MDLATFEENAGEVAQLLKALSNKRRLMILCKLAEKGEMAVGALVKEVGLSQSALSQHLARLREEKMVTYRREAQTLFYRIADPRCARLMGALYEIYCAKESEQ
ncbi:metalloregulator ArsR/SmtB family transcription factor [Altericroceibacterium endophyticum]